MTTTSAPPTAGDRTTSLRIIVLTFLAVHSTKDAKTWEEARVFVEKLAATLGDSGEATLAAAIQEDMDLMRGLATSVQATNSWVNS